MTQAAGSGSFPTIETRTAASTRSHSWTGHASFGSRSKDSRSTRGVMGRLRHRLTGRQRTFTVRISLPQRANRMTMRIHQILAVCLAVTAGAAVVSAQSNNYIVGAQDVLGIAVWNQPD